MWGSIQKTYGHQPRALPTTTPPQQKGVYYLIYFTSLSLSPSNKQTHTHKHFISPPKITENRLSQASPLRF